MRRKELLDTYSSGANAVAARERGRLYYRRHREKIIQKHRDRRLADPEGVLAVERFHRGQPAPTRPRPELCELCFQPSTHKSLHLDHCHKTNKFRGWLCAKCNMGIGHLGDDLDGLRAAVKYLESSE